jgi:hypothetical protein
MSKAKTDQRKDTKWVSYIYQALENLGGEATLQKIYAEVEKLRGAKYIDTSPNWKSNIQTTI